MRFLWKVLKSQYEALDLLPDYFNAKTFLGLFKRTLHPRE
jgi:hypothetical protein